MDCLGGAAWRGMAMKDHDLSKVHVVDGGHTISLQSRNDSIDLDIARLALMAMLRYEVRR